MKKKPMKFRLKAVRRTAKGKTFLVIELDGGNRKPASYWQEKALRAKGMWADGLTNSQAWWAFKWLLDKVKVSVDLSDAEIRMLKSRR